MVEGKKANLALRIGFSIAETLGLAGLCGCTEEEAILGRAAIAGISVNPRVVANPEASAWANAFSAGSQAQLDSINAGKMGTTVNVNVNRQNNTNILRVYDPIDKASYRKISMFNIRTTNDLTNNKTVYFEGEVLEENDDGFTVRVSSGQVYFLPKTQVVNQFGEYWSDKYQK